MYSIAFFCRAISKNWFCKIFSMYLPQIKSDLHLDKAKYPKRLRQTRLEDWRPFVQNPHTHMNCKLQPRGMCATIRVMATEEQDRHQMVTDVRATTSGCSAGPGQALEEASGSWDEQRGQWGQGERAPEKRVLGGIKQPCLAYHNILLFSEYNKQLCAWPCMAYV